MEIKNIINNQLKSLIGASEPVEDKNIKTQENKEIAQEVEKNISNMKKIVISEEDIKLLLYLFSSRGRISLLELQLKDTMQKLAKYGDKIAKGTE